MDCVQEEGQLLVTAIVLWPQVLLAVEPRHHVVGQDLAPAERASGEALLEPSVQAALVECVPAQQPPQLLPFLELRQAHSTLRAFLLR